MTEDEHNGAQEGVDLARFLSAQEGTFEDALRELRDGQKESHWMWFVFPQLDGLGSSPMAKEYAIRSLDEARAYLKHPVLGHRFFDCCQALLSTSGKSAAEIMGYPDDVKLKSSMTLFSLVEDGSGEFGRVLEKFFDGELDARTLELLKRPSAGR